MALTQISTGGVKDDAVTAGKIPAGAVGSSEIAKPIDLADNEKVRLGTGNDLEIYHNGTDNHIVSTNGQIDIKVASTEDAITAAPNGAVKLYYNNLLRFQTTSDGFQAESNTAEAVFTIRSTAQDGAPTLQFLSDDYDDNADRWRIRSDGGGTAFGIQNYASGSWEKNIVCQEDGGVELYCDDTKRVETNDSGALINNRLQLTGPSIYDKSGTGNSIGIQLSSQGVLPTNGSGTEVNNTKDLGSSSYKWKDIYAGGTVSDSKGDLRDIPANSQVNNTSYTLVAADSGKHVIVTANSAPTVTLPNNVFASGKAVTIVNNGTNDMTIALAAGVTMYNTADAATGNRTLAGRGMATILWVGASNAYISGAGLS